MVLHRLDSELHRLDSELHRLDSELTSPRFRAPPTPPPIDKSPTIPAVPPMSAYFPSCPFKVICRYCLRDDHDVRYSVQTAIRNEVVLIIMAGNALEIPFHARLFYN